MNRKKAIIIGSSGQDGQLLEDYLKNLKYDVLGINKNNFNINIAIYNVKNNDYYE